MMLWILAAALVAFAGLRYRQRLRGLRDGPVRVDDDAIRQILEQGSLGTRQPPNRLDMEAAAEAEDQFWSESWDEPEEYRP